MNQTEWQLAQYANWSLDRIGAYFVSKYNGRSEYALGREFAPEVLSELKLSQLHKTERQDGVYIHLSNGTPEIKPQVIAACEVNFSHTVMHGLMLALKVHNEQKWILIQRLAWRNKKQTRGEIYKALKVPKSTAQDWYNDAVEFMSDELKKVIAFSSEGVAA